MSCNTLSFAESYRPELTLFGVQEALTAPPPPPARCVPAACGVCPHTCPSFGQQAVFGQTGDLGVSVISRSALHACIRCIEMDEPDEKAAHQRWPPPWRPWATQEEEDLSWAVLGRRPLDTTDRE